MSFLGGKLSWVHGRGEELVLASSGVKQAAHGVEFAEVECENTLVMSSLRS